MVSDRGPELLGGSASMQAVRRLLSRASQVDVPVVLEGETGTGKSLAARWLHARSGRASAPFVTVNCSGIPDGLFESEFFGHRRGAFTGALADREGLFEAASGGTLLLDEVGELPAAQQSKLLVALETRTVRRVGETRSRAVDTRIVAATSARLDDAVRSGRFRADLFHRLAVLRCVLPPLRHRVDDIPILAGELLARLGRRHLGVPARLTLEAETWLRSRPWRGNVRELAHVLEAAIILAERRRLDVRALERAAATSVAPGREEASVGPAGDPVGGSAEAGSDEGRDGPPPPGDPAGSERSEPTGRYSFYGTDEEERATIRAALVRNRGNRTRTAAELGMSRTTLRARMRKYGI